MPQKFITDINKGTRALNYLIDVIAISFISQIIIVSRDNYINPTVFFLVIYFFYYLLFESFSGRTLGKIITGSKVVDKNNCKPNFLQILVRTTCRLSPFDWLSYAFGNAQGSHDALSRTKLVKLDKKNQGQ